MQGFLNNLKRFDENIAIISKNKSYTYKQFIQDVFATVLPIPDQSTVCLIGDFDYENIVKFFALALKKCIIAPLPKDSPSNFKKQEILMSNFSIYNSCIQEHLYTQEHSLIKDIKSTHSGVLCGGIVSVPPMLSCLSNTSIPAI